MRFVELRECGSHRYICVNPRHVIEVDPDEDWDGRTSCILVHGTPERRVRRVFGSADDVARLLSGGTRLA